ncbi:hypothetical protein GALMADRAFT_141004 [Galerina marginata CBS 339.88]|uniref:F-box domain-containing protein n=1 Tax=Galerina marginata (strain CBS 339.88) TaxID=685588 RepID=A0A067T6J9_GALM3|nr:hypothetical protein GALMADRAFT_141004 [Galerina marginata CBS 339.88]
MSSSFAPFSHLSQELIDEIIDSVLDTPGTAMIKPTKSHLCALALVYSGFRHRAQKHIFYSMPILSRTRQASYRDGINALHAILQENPRIASYVRWICFHIDSNIIEWAFDDPLFLQIMELITKTWAQGMELALSISGGSGDSQLFNNRSFEMRFVKPFVTPFITSLDLHYMRGVPLCLVAHCPHLKELTLNSVSMEAARPLNAIAIDNSLRPRPQKFTFESHGDTIRFLTATYIDFSHLQHLTVSGYSSLLEELPDIMRILDASFNSLQCLELECVSVEGLLSTFYDLSRIPNLVVLSISTVDLNDIDPCTDICILLRTISSRKNKLKKIALGFERNIDAPLSLERYLTKLETGRPLSTVLGEIAGQEQLVVKIGLQISLNYSEEMKGKWKEEMEPWVVKNVDLMTKFSSNVSLVFDYEFY